MHYSQQMFCIRVREKFPKMFFYKKVLDIGSQDVNGNNRFLFFECSYTGIDVIEGKNVDLVVDAYQYKSKEKFDVIISTEAFEHDPNYIKTLQNITVNLLKDEGLLFFTCGGTGRAEHGTIRTSIEKTDFKLFGNDYYKNLTEKDVRDAISMDLFSEYYFETNSQACDLYFYGIKKVASKFILKSKNFELKV
jgi:hypothetical protein